MNRADEIFIDVRPHSHAIPRGISALELISSFIGAFHYPASEFGVERAKFFWLVRLRWIAIALFMVFSVPALIAGFISRESIPIYIGLLGVLLVFNLLSQLIYSHRPIRELAICFQLAFDIGILSALLLTAGGFANPFVSLFFLNVAIGGLLVPSRLGWPFLLLVHSMLLVIQLFFVIDHQQEVSVALIATMTIYHLIVLGFWFVMRSLGSYLDQQMKAKMQMQVQFEKQSRLRAIGALAGGFSHEFASPLNAAKIYLERMSRTLQSNDLQNALAAVHSCESVIRQMNDSQLDSRDFQFKSVIVADLLRDVVGSWQLDHPNTKLTAIFGDRHPSKIPPINFSQVVLNLLDNAFEAKPSGPIEISLCSNEGKFVLKVTDCGIGFSEKILQKIGEPFVTSKSNGTGLGIYVSNLFALSVGGQLSVHNNSPEPGASVSLVWPREGIQQ